MMGRSDVTFHAPLALLTFCNMPFSLQTFVRKLVRWLGLGAVIVRGKGLYEVSGVSLEGSSSIAGSGSYIIGDCPYSDWLRPLKGMA